MPQPAGVQKLTIRKVMIVARLAQKIFTARVKP